MSKTAVKDDEITATVEYEDADGNQVKQDLDDLKADDIKHMVEPPKDKAVAEEVKVRQMPLFDGYQVEARSAKMKASDTVLLSSDEPTPKFKDRRVFLVEAEVAEVTHKTVTVKLGHGLTDDRLTRIAVFDAVSIHEISSKVQGLIKKAMDTQEKLG